MKNSVFHRRFCLFSSESLLKVDVLASSRVELQDKSVGYNTLFVPSVDFRRPVVAALGVVQCWSQPFPVCVGLVKP